MVVAVVSCGVTPLATTMVGEMDPENKSFPVPLDAVPIPMKVSVSLPPVADGKDTVLAGEAAFDVTVQPPELRARATRA